VQRQWVEDLKRSAERVKLDGKSRSAHR